MEYIEIMEHLKGLIEYAQDNDVDEPDSPWAKDIEVLTQVIDELTAYHGYSKHIACIRDGLIYTIDETIGFYREALEAKQIDIEDYPSFEDYYESITGMGEYTYGAKLVPNETIKGYNVYIYCGCKYCATLIDDNKIIIDGCIDIEELRKELDV